MRNLNKIISTKHKNLNLGWIFSPDLEKHKMFQDKPFQDKPNSFFEVHIVKKNTIY